MIEGVVLLKYLVEAFELTPSGQSPVPVAHLTLRAEDGIYLKLRDLAD